MESSNKNYGQQDSKRSIAPSAEFKKEWEQQQEKTKQTLPVISDTSPKPTEVVERPAVSPEQTNPNPFHVPEFSSGPPATLSTTTNSVPTRTASDTKEPGFFESFPKGILVIVILSLIGTGISLLSASGSQDTNQNGGIVVFSSIIGVLLALGLLTRNNIARIIFLIFGSLTVLSSLIGIFNTIDVQQNFYKNKELTEAKIQELKDKGRLTEKEEQSLSQLESTATEANKVTSSAFNLAYLSYFVGLVYSSFVVVYLLRPSIKDYFSP